MVGESLLFKSESEEQTSELPPAYENLSQHFLELTCRHISFIPALRSEQQSQKSQWAINIHLLLESGPPTSWPSGELSSLQGAGVSLTSLQSTLLHLEKIKWKGPDAAQKEERHTEFHSLSDTVRESLYWLLTSYELWASHILSNVPTTT